MFRDLPKIEDGALHETVSAARRTEGALRLPVDRQAAGDLDRREAGQVAGAVVSKREHEHDAVIAEIHVEAKPAASAAGVDPAVALPWHTAESCERSVSPARASRPGGSHNPRF